MLKIPNNPPQAIPKIFGIGRSRLLAQELCELLGVEIQQLQEETFPDGEIKIKPVCGVAGQPILVLHSMAREAGKTPSEKIWELLMFLSLLKDEGAGPVTALLPYFCYSRSDQKKEFQEPLTLRFLAQLYEAAGLQKLITLDVHNLAAFQNAFRCQSLNLEAAGLFCDYLKTKDLPEGPLVVMSPDFGGIKRGERFSQQLQMALGRPVSMSIVEKYREGAGLRGQALFGPVQGAEVLIYDDIISTGKTILRAAALSREKGARAVTVLVTHGLFSQDPVAVLESPLIDEIVVTNSNVDLLTPEFTMFSKLKIISCAKVLAQGFCLSSASFASK